MFGSAPSPMMMPGTKNEAQRTRKRDRRLERFSEVWKGTIAMNMSSMDTVMMVARIEQEYRMEQAAKANHRREAERLLRGNRVGLFSRRTRGAK